MRMMVISYLTDERNLQELQRKLCDAHNRLSA
jgi:hypothetical protein